jgi:hypothetical protein
MKKNIVSAIVYLTICTTLWGQTPGIIWEKTFGGSNFDSPTSITRVNDGNYVVAGWTYSNDIDVIGNHGGIDVWVIKIDQTGNILWKKTIGGSSDDVAYSVASTNDGGVIISGWSDSNDGDISGNHGGSDCLVLKLSSIGNIEWQKSIGGSASETGYSIFQTKDNGYILSGWSNSNDGDANGNTPVGGADYWVVKLTSSGGIQWQKSYGGSGTDWAFSTVATTDNGYIVGGYSDSNDGDITNNKGSFDFWLLKIDSTGTKEWEKSLGGSGIENLPSITKTTDGMFLICGTSNSNDGDISGNHGDNDIWIAKFNSLGNIIWQKTLGGPGNDGSKSIIEISNGTYVITGISSTIGGDVTSNFGQTDFWVINIDSLSTIISQKSMGGTSSENAQQIIQDNTGSLVLAGETMSNDFDVTGNNGTSDFWIVKLASSISSIEENLSTSSDIAVFPNPSKNMFNISVENHLLGEPFEVFNQIGSKIFEGIIHSKTTQINLNHLPEGLYFLKISSEIKVINLQYE